MEADEKYESVMEKLKEMSNKVNTMTEEVLAIKESLKPKEKTEEEKLADAKEEEKEDHFL